MRKVLYVAVILVPILMLAFAAPALAKGKEKPPKPAKLDIDPKKIDFGKAMGGESVERTVNVSNKGEAEAKDVKCVPGGVMGKWVTLTPDTITVAGGKDAKPVEVKMMLKAEPQEVKKDKKGKEVPGKDEKRAGNIECKYGEGKKLNIPIMFVHVPGKKEEVKKEEPKKEEAKPAEPVAPAGEKKDAPAATPAAPAKEEPKKEEPKKEEPKKEEPKKEEKK